MSDSSTGFGIARTYVTRMTGDEPAAIAVLRIWGDRALAVCDELFQARHGRRRLAESETGELRLGQFVGDEVVALICEDPATGLTEVEIQGHGSPLLIESILRRLSTEGVEIASQGEFQKAHGIMRLERLAHEHLGRVASTRAATVLVHQVQGALRSSLVEIVVLLTDDKIAEAESKVGALLNTAVWGTRLSSGFRVALAGLPNVGKSTLVNALAGYERTLVSPVPGTTRDLVEVPLVLGGWPIIFTDTAGLRDETADELEAEGVRLARQEHLRADLVLRLSEFGTDPPHEPADTRTLDVLTKADLLPDRDRATNREGAIVISARTGEGLETLIRAILERLLPAEASDPKTAAKGVVFDESIAESLRKAERHLASEDCEAARKALVEWLEAE